MSSELLIAGAAALVASGCAWLVARQRAVAAERRRVTSFAERSGLELGEARAGRELGQLAEQVEELQRRAARASRSELRLRVAEEESARLRCILETLPDGVMVFEGGERLVAANAAARKLLRCPEDGAPALATARGDAELLAAIREVLRADLARGLCARKVELAGRGERERAIWRVRALVADGEACTGVPRAVLLLEDQSFEEASARMRSEFVYGVSHELKTPLTSIQASLEMLVEDEEDGGGVAAEDRSRLLHLAHGESVRLARMIQELLELARVEAGITQVRRERVEVAPLLGELREAHRPLAERKSIELDWRVSPYVPALQGDRELLRQALVNLISNAIKYTPEGGRVELDAALEGEELSIAVTDTGIGIGPEDLPRIFDKFYRASQAQSSRIPGTGLGLPLARYLVESHGGRIEVESVLGQGSTFRVRLPVLAAGGEEPVLQLASIGGWSGGAA
ncbi:MAG: PAS domain-containing protein [Planctomycetes bacterium]|nr:PAS domain-containing protein [Planctomycetota bacterium]